MQVGMHLRPLQQVGVLPVRRTSAHAEARGSNKLPPFAQRGAEREIALRVRGGERDVFEAVQRLGAQGRIGEDGPVLGPTVHRNARSDGGGHGRGSYGFGSLRV